MQQDEFLTWWVKALAYIAFSSIGGIFGHLMRTFEKKESVHWGRACIEGLSAGFVGLLVLLMCQATGLSEQWTGVIVGVSGWLGASATIRLLERMVRKRLGVDYDGNDVPPLDKPAQ